MIHALLKHCPFCGQIPVLQKDIRYPRPECKPVEAFEVVCKNWDCIIGYADDRYRLTEEEAVEWWNKRAGDADESE